MSSPENTFRSPELFAPDTGSDGGSDFIRRNDLRRSCDAEDVISTVRNIQADTIARTYFELFELGTTALLPALEASGVIPPTLDNPNPFDAELAQEDHEQWWQEHIEEATEFNEALTRRERVVDFLYFGTYLNRLSSGRLYASWSLPSSFAIEDLTRYFKREYTRAVAHSVILELGLEDEGLLAVFEEVGIVPPRVQDLPEDVEGQSRLPPAGGLLGSKTLRSSLLGYIHTGGLLNILINLLHGQKNG